MTEPNSIKDQIYDFNMDFIGIAPLYNLTTKGITAAKALLKDIKSAIKNLVQYLTRFRLRTMLLTGNNVAIAALESVA